MKPFLTEFIEKVDDDHIFFYFPLKPEPSHRNSSIFFVAFDQIQRSIDCLIMIQPIETIIL